MQWREKPVILLGNGVTGDCEKVLELGLPVLTSWQAKDLVDNHHPYYFGSPGIYGQRVANRVLFEADQILALGNRMAIWNVGYEGPRPDQDVVMVDVDGFEVTKFPSAFWIRQDAARFLGELEKVSRPEWVSRCNGWRTPLVEECHADTKHINSYRFVQEMEKLLRPDEVIVTDMGTALICAHQVLRLKPPQRLMTSGGLGEMGCALPAAVGACFARGKKDVLCLTTDGGMMMNLQELQTILHHKLPVKMVVFRNEGYLMIQHTQRVAGMKESGVGPESGVSFPDYRRLFQSMGGAACDVRTWADFAQAMPMLFATREPALVQFHMEPRQPLVPKLDPVFVDGKPTSPPFWKMTP